LAVLAVAGVAGADSGRELAQLTAKAAIAVDVQTGTVYFTRNASTPLPPASTTKVLTAVVALQNTAPDELMRVSSHAASMPPSKAYLKSGTVYTSRSLLHALMLRSANDASVVIAEHVGGSVPGFARLMNQTARSLGATQSNFITPNGLPMRGHVSTAQDLARIMRGALQTPGMRSILSKRTEVIEAVSGRAQRIALRSTNRMLWRDDLSVLGKTGWTREAKRCFVGVASANGREVIIAILGSRDLWGDVELLSTFGLGRAVPNYDEWRNRAGLQQAAIDPPAAGAAPPVTWHRGTGQVAPPPTRNPHTAPAPQMQAFQERSRAATRSTASARRPEVPQGDREDLRRAQLRYHVELGSFKSKVRAQQLARDLAKRGYRAEIRPTGRMHQLVVKNFTTRDAARKAAVTLGRALKVEPVVTASR
jgi:D-alanyl-D-alanine carboxypeptidase (penicillin-binding protein 5/6)